MKLSKKQKAVVLADEILTDLLTEMSDIEFLVKTGQFESYKNKKFWVKELDKRKTRLDRRVEEVEQKMANISEWPKSLSHTFNTAKKRKMVVKGRLTNVQKKLRPAPKR